MTGAPPASRYFGRASKTKGRLLVLAALAAIPLALLTTVIAWQGYATSERSVLGETSVFGGVAQGQFTRLTDTLHQRLQAMVGAGDICAQLASGDGTGMLDIDGLVLFDALGAVRCQTPADAARAVPAQPAPSWFEHARGGAPFAIGEARPGGASVFAAPAPGGGVLAALLPPTWRTVSLLPDPDRPGGAAWVLDAAGGTVTARGAVATAQPDIPTTTALDADDTSAVAGWSLTGQAYDYTSIPLGAGLRLLAARPAARERDIAVRVLVQRLAELATVVVISVSALVLSADVAFGRPVRRLRAAVERWRSGGAFDPEPLTGAPDEVLELAQSFRDATEALRAQAVQLTRAKEQQDLLVLEVHHRVKNNLQVIASLLNLQASRIRVPEARAEFQAARDRVRALATLHRHLYSEGELNAINMRSFLVELCDQLFQAMGEVPGERIDLQIEAPELRLSSEQAVPLALIVTEAVTNSVKYAFPDARSGCVGVRLVQQDGELDLFISDDGVGIPAGPAATESGMRDGLGRQLIRGFARQLGATLAVEEGAGTRYAVRLALRPSDPASLPISMVPGAPA